MTVDRNRKPEEDRGQQPDRRRRQEAEASMSVEASYILSIVLLCLALLIRYGFCLHDQVVGNAVINEGLELLGHSEEADPDEIASRGGKRMEHALSGRGYQVQFSSYQDGFMGTGGGVKQQVTLTDKGFHPEKMMRRITLIEALGG